MATPERAPSSDSPRLGGVLRAMGCSVVSRVCRARVAAYAGGCDVGAQLCGRWAKDRLQRYVVLARDLKRLLSARVGGADRHIKRRLAYWSADCRAAIRRSHNDTSRGTYRAGG